MSERRQPLFLLSSQAAESRPRFAYPTSAGGYWPEPQSGKLCPSCGKKCLTWHGIKEAVVEGPAKWPDILGAARDVTAVFSARAADALSSCSGVSFAPMPIRHTKASVVPPAYFHPTITGKVLLNESVLNEYFEITCNTCRLRRNRTVKKVQSYKLVQDSWDGADFCKFANIDLPHIICSEKVIHLAHEQRWTNAHFVLVDSDQDHPYAVDGIDYLAKKWPPESWELPDPLAKQPLNIWGHQLESSDTAVSYEARRVLRYVGEPARAVLIPLLDSANPIARRDAANLLYNLHKSAPLEPPILTRVLGLKSVPT